jgi:alkaline phosphatase
MHLRLALSVLLAAVHFAAAAPRATEDAVPRVKNVILMIPDGCGVGVATAARWRKGAPLALDGIVRGMVKTHSLDSAITDSAASATAYATGHKTRNGWLSVVPDREHGSLPVATVLEGAKASGRSAGLVCSSAITHATPAAFAAHVSNRTDEAAILRDMSGQYTDVLFGGGRGLLSATSAVARADDRLVSDVFWNLGCRGVSPARTPAELRAAPAPPVWGLFADGHLPPDLSRTNRLDQPTLAEMTDWAIGILSRNTNGFFLMVEGSQVDWGCHSHDPAYAVSEFLAFDDAVAVALRFAGGRGAGETLLIACSDHGTGGFSLGNTTYGAATATNVPALLAGMRRTVPELAADTGFKAAPGGWGGMVLRRLRLSARMPRGTRGALRAGWGIDPTKADMAGIASRLRAGASMETALSEVILPRYSPVGWTSWDHVGDDVCLWAYGPGAPAGLLDNTEIGRRIALSMGVDLDALTRQLRGREAALKRRPGARTPPSASPAPTYK